MKPIREVYPSAAYSNGDFGYVGDYDPLLESFGYEILLKVDDDDYQGDFCWHDEETRDFVGKATALLESIVSGA